MKRLTKYPPASFQEVSSLAFSFIFVLFSASLMGFCDRVILARFSLEAVETSVSVLYLIQLFQIPVVRIASTAQIFVGHYKGANELRSIGPVVWQMIWFSIISIVIIGPLSSPICALYFQNTPLQREGISYFQYFIAINALFPLSAALSSFYLGQGKTKIVLISSLACHSLHILLDVLFIFGIQGLIPSLGLKGAAFASAISQFLFCAVLLLDFLKPIHRYTYGTSQTAFQWSLFWKCLKIGLPRAGNKMVHLAAWVAVTYVMIHREADYIAILTFGGALNLFYTCFNEGLSQALITIGAYLIGTKEALIWKLARSASLFLAVEALILAIPCLFFQENLLSLFFKDDLTPSLREQLYFSCYWLWFLFITQGLNLIGLGLLSAYGDTVFQVIFSTSSAWITSFLPVYLIIGTGNAPPSALWIIMTGTCLIAAIAYFFRLRQEKWKLKAYLEKF